MDSTAPSMSLVSNKLRCPLSTLPALQAEAGLHKVWHKLRQRSSKGAVPLQHLPRQVQQPVRFPPCMHRCRNSSSCVPASMKSGGHPSTLMHVELFIQIVGEAPKPSGIVHTGSTDLTEGKQDERGRGARWQVLPHVGACFHGLLCFATLTRGRLGGGLRGGGGLWGGGGCGGSAMCTLPIGLDWYLAPSKCSDQNATR